MEPERGGRWPKAEYNRFEKKVIFGDVATNKQRICSSNTWVHSRNHALIEWYFWLFRQPFNFPNIFLYFLGHT